MFKKNILVNFKKGNFSKGVIFNFISTVILGVSGIILNTIIGNHYGPTGLGIFNQSLAIYTITSLFAVLGLQISVVKYTAEFKDDQLSLNSLISSSILIIFPFSILLTAILISISFIFPNIYFNNEVTISTRYILFGIPLFVLNKIYAALLNGKRDMRIYAINQSIRWVLILILILTALFFNLGIEYSVLSFFITEVFLLIWMVIYTKKYFSFVFEYNRLWLIKHFEFGSKTLLLSMLGEVNNKADIFLIGFFLSSYYVGIYSFASTIVNGLLMFSGVVQLNINPIISNLWAKGEKEQILIYSSKVAKATAIIIIPLILISAIAYPVFINLFMHEASYLESIPVFYILLAGIILPGIYYFTGAYFAMANLLNVNLVTASIKVAFNIIAAIVLINIFGFWGAAMSTSLTYIVGLNLSNYFMRSKMGFSLFTFKSV